MILMPLMSNNIVWVTGGAELAAKAQNTPARPLFDDEILAFLSCVSKELMLCQEVRKYPDVATFAFWLRPASLVRMKAYYTDRLNNRFGRGLVFHIPPSNVPVNFAYSLAVGLISGNPNILRLSSKDFPQVDLICRAISKALYDYESLLPYVLLMRYGHQQSITDALSVMCQVRVVWGGDQGIENIRRSPLGARAVEITFADRYAVCLIEASHYLDITDKEAVAEKFYNDTLLMDQNACSSPKLVVWLGSDIDLARETFWTKFEKLAEKKYNLQPATAINKLKAFCSLCARLGRIWKCSGNDNLIFRAEVDRLEPEMMDYVGHGGFFLEYRAESIDDILPVCGLKCQTLTCLGIDRNLVDSFIKKHRPSGLDRVVPVGQALDFSLQWDGFDLVYSLSRIIKNSL